MSSLCGEKKKSCCDRKCNYCAVLQLKFVECRKHTTTSHSIINFLFKEKNNKIKIKHKHKKPYIYVLHAQHTIKTKVKCVCADAHITRVHI